MEEEHKPNTNLLWYISPMERSLNAPSNFNLLINLLLIACGVGRVYPLNQGIVMSVLIRRGGKRTFQYTIMIVGKKIEKPQV